MHKEILPQENPERSAPERKLLVDMLEQAGQLEHCLLNTYLYAACSLKSMPQEFETVGNEGAQEGSLLNRRRAIVFERARAWKQALLGVAREEMVHMHYVECLRRGLGERPSLSLPKRDPKTDNWLVPNWKARVGDEPVNDGKGVEVPIASLDQNLIRGFVVYESTDNLQDNNPFTGRALEMFRTLYDIEQDFLYERMLFAIEDDTLRNKLKAQLAKLYNELTPIEEPLKKASVELVAEPLPPLDQLHFQSIADFYYKGIKPLYAQAFDRRWVTHNNRLLNNEIASEDEGFLNQLIATGPVHRDKNFSNFRANNAINPLDHMKSVDDIIKQIVEEGEGATGFEDRANAFIDWYKKNGGRSFQQKLNEDNNVERDPKYSTPPWLSSAQLLRNSHLYRFAMIMIGMERETELAKSVGLDFEPARRPTEITDSVQLKMITEELPAQFNACYLVLLSWLARIYEIQTWEADKPQRIAIENIATWPLMSMAIRPMLELVSFFPVDKKRLFRWDSDALPMLPIHAQQLRRQYVSNERSPTINEEMDYLAVRVLADVAAWASSKVEVIKNAKINENRRKMIIRRLEGLSHLDEFQKQFPFRVAGGYSNVPPDTAFAKAAKEPNKYEESPGGPDTLFESTVVLRLRFSGWGLVQLATDPDPTWDEVGCTGTHMLHASDGDRRFDTALVWQNSTPNQNILRGPEGKVPKLGVQCREAALLVAPGKASAGYVPLGNLNSTGAVQTSGVQQKVAVQGFHELLSLKSADIVPLGAELPLELLSKREVRPFLNGLNHLVWRDGEPIDPFIPELRVRENGQEHSLFRREIFNEDRMILQFSPLQRQNTSRGPVGFDSYRNIPEWVMAVLDNGERSLMTEPGYPMTWLQRRAISLSGVLQDALEGADKPEQKRVDTIVSLAERMRLVSVPRSTTVGWLNYLLHYGHTVSGPLQPATGNNPIFAVLEQKTGLDFQETRIDDRSKPNARWFIGYTKGVMDTDSLSDLVFGELYIPLTIVDSKKTRIAKSWNFPKAMRDAVAAYACRFNNPFWAKDAKVDGNVRKIPMPQGGTITETQVNQQDNGYKYVMEGVPGINVYGGEFCVSEANGSGQISLSWSVHFMGDDPQCVMTMLGIIGAAESAMTAAMTRHFAPE